MDDRPLTGTIFGRDFKRNFVFRQTTAHLRVSIQRAHIHSLRVNSLGTSESPAPPLPQHLSSNSFAYLTGSRQIVHFPAGFNEMKTITEKNPIIWPLVGHRDLVLSNG